MAENLNKHQQLARTGHAEGYAKGGHVHMHEHHPKHHHGGHSPMKEHRVGHSHGGSIHNVTSQHGESTSSWDTDSVGTDGGKKHLGGGGTGGTRNRI